VTEKYKSDFCHAENDLPVFVRIVYTDKDERALNKHGFFAYFNQLDTQRPENTGESGIGGRIKWVFPAHG
jgi:hypothetical protein